MKRITTMMHLRTDWHLNGGLKLGIPLQVKDFFADAQNVTAGIVAGSALVFATVGMMALMAVADLAHAQDADDTYNLSKPVEPSTITPIITQERTVTTSADANGTVTTDSAVTVVNQDTAIIKTVETRDVRVMLPNGEVIVVANPVNAPWWQDERVSTYRTYYYDPDKDYYVIYTDEARPGWKKWEHRWDASGKACAPGVTSCQ